jgi:type IV pilus assembly protein PilW
MNIESSDGSSTFACTAYRASAVASADTLTIRRAAATPSTGATGRLRVCSTRVMGELVTDSSGCTTAPAGQVNDLIVNAYYISQDSTDRPGLPSLQRIALTDGPAFVAEEIVPGIEDMQIQFGVDPTGMRGVATRYVNPGDVAAGEQIVSVRIWLLIRSETPEVGFVDGRTYAYADRDEDNGKTANLNAASAATQAYEPADGFRRLLVSRTIQIRNILGT